MIDKSFLAVFAGLSVLIVAALALPDALSELWWRVSIGVGLSLTIGFVLIKQAAQLGWKPWPKLSLSFGSEVLLQLVTLQAVLATAIGMFLQINEMQRAYGPLRDQAVAALQQAKLASDLAESSKDDLASTNRAWVGVFSTTIDGIPVLNSDIQVEIKYKNFGKSPALSVLASAQAVIDTDQGIGQRVWDNLVACSLNRTSLSAHVLFPTSESLHSRIITKVHRSAVSPEFLSGDKTLVVFGCLTYSSFQKVHHTAFCNFFKAGQTPTNGPLIELNYCGMGANAD